MNMINLELLLSRETDPKTRKPNKMKILKNIVGGCPVCCPDSAMTVRRLLMGFEGFAESKCRPFLIGSAFHSMTRVGMVIKTLSVP